jgi:hypothetical protein
MQNAITTMLPMADKDKIFNLAVGEWMPEDEFGEAVLDTCSEGFEDLPATTADGEEAVGPEV